MPEGLGVFDTVGSCDGLLPPKEPGVHRWVASVAYTLTVEQMGRAAEGIEGIQLDHSNRISFGIGCWDCEMSFPEGHDIPCPDPGD